MTDSTAREDALRLARPPERVFFANGALLDETDFRAEQDYHRTRLARLAAYLHGAGTVAGLLVRAAEVGPDERELVVEPGLALDRIGRMIELEQASCLRLGRWLSQQSQATLQDAFRPEGAPDRLVLDVFLAFHVCEGALQPAFARRDMDALDAVEPSRIRDHGRLDLVLRRREEDLDARRPSFRPRFRLAEGEPPLELQAPVTRETLLDFKLRHLWRVLRPVAERTDLTRLVLHGFEHVAGQDGTELLLARVVVPALVQEGRIVLDLARPVEVDNALRLLSYATAELALLAGIEG